MTFSAWPSILSTALPLNPRIGRCTLLSYPLRHSLIYYLLEGRRGQWGNERMGDRGNDDLISRIRRGTFKPSHNNGAELTIWLKSQYVCIYFCLSVYLSACIYACVCSSAWMFVCLSVCLCVYLLSLCPSACLSVCLSIYLYLSPSAKNVEKEFHHDLCSFVLHLRPFLFTVASQICRHRSVQRSFMVALWLASCVPSAYLPLPAAPAKAKPAAP